MGSQQKVKRHLFVEMITDPATSSVSHRRVIAVASFFMLIALVVLENFIVLQAIDKEIDKDLIYTFAGLCGSSSALTIFGNKTNRNKDNQDEKIET